MKNSIMTIALEFSNNSPYLSYIIRAAKNQIGQIDSIYLNIKPDKDLFLELESAIECSKNLLIFVEHKSFVTVSKVIATISGDSLELKDDLLLPTRSEIYAKNSFLVKIGDKNINLLSLGQDLKIPEILINHRAKNATLHLFGMDIDSAKILLSTLLETKDFRTEICTFIDGWIIVRIDSKNYSNISNFITQSKKLFGNKILASSSVIAHIIEKLYENEKKITFAESCTGGALASLFTKESGCSKVLDGSVIAYANLIKECWLEVDEENLIKHGAVSESVVDNMLSGILKLSGANYAIATSGVAGPSGGTISKPVGCVFVGAKRADGFSKVERLQLEGDRNFIQEQACWHGIRILLTLDPDLFIG